MAERMHIPTSPACGQWETLLADALDGLLSPADEATFAAHMAACPACTALFEEARRGREWLEFLSPEPEVPAGLVDKILAHTGPRHAAALPLAGDMLPAVPGVLAMPAPRWQRPGFMGFVQRFAEPRLMMTAAMAFFSIALTLNITGVRLTSLRLSDLRPSAIRSFMERQLTMASVPIIRYYDHLRFVYEVETKMRELRGTTQQGEENHPQQNNSQPGQSQQTPHKDGGSRVDPPQQSSDPENGLAPEIAHGFVETSLTFEARPVHSGGSAQQYGKGAWYGLRQS
ncbi:MAG TPA: zf-HC2 domain-containing protein [Terracidiphilus sp.]|nr:zf-HC2 domain-containing protein [Terracidiphilus sp.]